MQKNSQRTRVKAAAALFALLAIFSLVLPSCSEAESKKVVIAIAEPGYNTAVTLPALAKKIWTEELGYEVTIIIGDPKKHDLTGLPEALKDADVLVTSVRRQALPADQLTALRKFLAAGKPLLAIRTSSHGFTAVGKGPAGNPEWPAFDTEVIGAAFKTHKGNDKQATFTAVKNAEKHPVLKGVSLPFSSGGGIYFSSPLGETTTPLLIGSIPGLEPEPVAWTNVYGANKGKIFYTSLGQEEEFAQAAFQKLLSNAMDWLLSDE